MEVLVQIMDGFVENWELVLLFFMVAILYSSVGFGGGSSYLAILANVNIAFPQMRAIALICNVVVVSGGSAIFINKGLLPWRKVIPLVIISVPLAFVGGYINLSEKFFFILLGITLVLAAVAMLLSKIIVTHAQALKPLPIRDGLIGGGIGLLSGIVRIGGGIFLAPLLHLTKWDRPKKIAATTSFFILVNSIAGLAGQYFSKSFVIDFTLMFPLILSVFLGGLLGSRLTAYRISPILLKRLTAVLIMVVGLRLLLK